jgi:hypothetical protein
MGSLRTGEGLRVALSVASSTARADQLNGYQFMLVCRDYAISRRRPKRAETPFGKPLANERVG